MNKYFYRHTQLLLLLFTMGVIFISFYLQYVQGLQPCPLCLMQRFCTFILFFLFLVGLRLNMRRRGGLVIFLQSFFSIAGLFFAARQLWLQTLAKDSMPACLPGLDILVQYFPWQDIAHALFWGSGECGEITWSWLGLSLPVWSTFYFILVFMTSLFTYIHLKRSDLQ